MTNCPNCGAVITGSKCEYCDTRFDVVYAPKRESYTSIEKLKIESELIQRTVAIKELYAQAIAAMRKYGGM